VSNLAQAIIKERDEDEASIKSSRTTGSQDELTDDQLALMGPPWAKEGNLFRKLYLNAEGKRSKDKNWKQVFAVLQKGEIHMFVFGEGADLKDRKGVGGGNWMVSIRYIV
jgi:PH/SEC7 domain-containing protein